MSLKHAVGLVVLLVVAGCGDDDASAVDTGDGGACPVGSESCSCTVGEGCNPGLTCVSKVCVDLSGIDEAGSGGGGAGRGSAGRGSSGTGGSSGTSGSSGTGGSSGSGGSIAPMGDATQTLNAMVVLPNEGAPLNNPQVDESVQLDVLPVGGTQPLIAGSTVTVSLPFTAPNSDVVAAGIRFGNSGPIRTVMIPDAQGVSSASLDFDMQVPPEVCNDLANICHNIQCYEFAVTSAGRISRENIMDLALLCGSCTEPTCQALLPAGACTVECMDASECDPGQACSMGLCVGEGALRFTLTWSATTDLDLHVVTPTGTEIYFGNPTADSGDLDRDNTSGGPGSVENIYFTAPPVGAYTYSVINYSGSQSGSYTLQVFKEGALVATQNGSLPAEGGSESPEYMISAP